MSETNYNYIARDRAGAVRSGTVRATDRTEAIRALREQGLVPTNLQAAKSVSPRRRQRRHPAVLTALIALVALVALLTLHVLKRPAAQPRRAAPTALEGHAPSRPLVRQPEAAQHQQADVTASGRDTAPAEHPGTLVARGTLPISSKNSEASAPEAVEDDLEPPAKKKSSPFRTLTEQYLSMVSGATPGVPLPPMPIFTGDSNDFQRAMTNLIVIEEDDSPERVRHIEKVAWAKVDLKELVEQGWQPGEVLQALAAQHNESANHRIGMLLALKGLLDTQEATPKELLANLPEINAELKELGLPEISPSELGLEAGEQ